MKINDFYMVSVSFFQKTNITEDSGARKMENFTFKANSGKAFLFALVIVIASIYAFGYAVKGDFFLLLHRIFPQVD